MPLQSSQTFSERRGDGPLEMNRTNLSRTNGMNPLNDGNEEKGKGDSVVKVLIWVVVVVLVAVVIYLVINNLTGTKKTETPTGTDTETEEEQGLEPITAQKISSEGVEGAPVESDFATDSQSVGSETTDEFTLDSVSVESYEEFLRIVFAVTSNGSDKFPLTQAVLENEEITVTLNNISEENTEIGAGEEQEIIGSVVTGILHSVSANEGEQQFVIRLDSETGYYLHLLEEPNRIIIDVAEPKEDTTTEEPTTETPEEPTGEETTGKPTTVTLTNEFSKNPQWVVSEVTGNTVTTTKYQWQDFGTYVKITYDLSGGIPNVEAELDEEAKELTVVMSNRVAKNASSTIEINHGNVTTMDAVTAGNISTLTIHLVKSSDYRIYATEGPDKFIIEVKD